MPQNQAEKNQPTKSQEGECGVCSEMFSAKTGVEGKDGGVVSALLIGGFEAGLFDAAVVVRRGAGYSAEAVVAVSSEEVLAAKGTRYLKVNVTKTLRELINQGKKHVAIVCTPCEAKAARKIQQNAEDCEITIIGLFCFEAFNAERIKDNVKCLLGVDLDSAEKTQVMQGKFSAFVAGKEHSCRVKDLDLAAEKVCGFCSDFTAEYADVSVGSVGSQKGYSTVIVRTERGKNLVERLDVAKEPVDIREVARLSKFKRERAEKNLVNAKKPK
jgi:coenzyme F420-reducing hydrogenase beta subunit